ncbi:DUF6503 family protein [Winogradskyella sediminis]|uniref:DUF6503 family protein n=1 Tax=Winogradskyella sediminis TaxID=1382466 RepID=UPI000E2247D8|nr:DUF6503 family protein [Winogradskyella sediminis]REG89048.1 hypothetical protein C8N41_101284 [Winogradskyella sediminis]
MKTLLSISICILFFSGFSQDLKPQELLEKAISYHDPNGNWLQFKDTFTVEMTMPNAPKRTSVITINLPDEYFSVTATKDTVATTYTLVKDKCQMQYNGVVLDSLKAADKDMTCDRATLYKNYYSYLYGLPMKLRDPGTNLSDNVEKKRFKGKDYLVLKVTYDDAVGNDVWYFYFNPKTYAMEIYQFFKTDDQGKVKPESGEYILLTGETLLNGIKIPKVRAWYYNKEDKYLGADTLIEN